MLPLIALAASSLYSMYANQEKGKKDRAAEIDNAISSIVRGHFEQRGMKKEQARLQSTIQNQVAGAGLDMSGGSPLLAYLDATKETALDLELARRDAGKETGAYLTRADRIREETSSNNMGIALNFASSYMGQQAKMKQARFMPSTVTK